jgi:hypothetical protein
MRDFAHRAIPLAAAVALLPLLADCGGDSNAAPAYLDAWACLSTAKPGRPGIAGSQRERVNTSVEARPVHFQLYGGSYAQP